MFLFITDRILRYNMSQLTARLRISVHNFRYREGYRSQSMHLVHTL